MLLFGNVLEIKLFSNIINYNDWIRKLLMFLPSLKFFSYVYIFHL